MTKTREKYLANQKARDQMNRELFAIICAEFPKGTKVRWQHGRHWQSGEVVELPAYDWQSDVKVRNIATGTQRRVDAAQLELDNER